MRRTPAQSANVIDIASSHYRHSQLTREESKALAHTLAKHIAAQWIYEVRTKKEVTQEQLGKMIGVTGARISQLENPNHVAPVSLEILCEIAQALDVQLVLKRPHFANKPKPEIKELSVR